MGTGKTTVGVRKNDGARAAAGPSLTVGVRNGDGSPAFRCRAFFPVVALLLCWCGTAGAEPVDGYLHLQGSYMPLKGDSGTLHFPALSVGGGCYVNDYSVVEGSATWGGTYGQQTFQQAWTIQAAYRFLIDATQWIPSFGITFGYLGRDSAAGDPAHGLTLGLSVCIDYRKKRERSVGLCGEWHYPFFQGALNSMFLVGLRVGFHFPYARER
jgi:hypothetical protein